MMSSELRGISHKAAAELSSAAKVVVVVVVVVGCAGAFILNSWLAEFGGAVEGVGDGVSERRGGVAMLMELSDRLRCSSSFLSFLRVLLSFVSFCLLAKAKCLTACVESPQGHSREVVVKPSS